ncbi:sodium-translocating pyrophosphatase [Nanoarchaeota archaeon]|nr:MAG: sodium-translocating pyrophosphatase [Nanoarchaeota archaeon]
MLGVFVLAYGLIVLAYLFREKVNTKSLNVAKKIQSASDTFIQRQYLIIFCFVAVVALLLGFIGVKSSVAFVVGAALSMLAGYLGMFTSTRMNARLSQTENLGKAVRKAFLAGSVVGSFVVGLALLGLYVAGYEKSVLFAFSFGASAVALFARLGGGIFTKSADVAADYVWKFTRGMKEDDVRNPAAIADNVGDNVGDVAGMSADLFESYVASIIAAIALGEARIPIMLASIGAIVSMIIVPFIYVRKSDVLSVLRSMRAVSFISVLLTATIFYVVGLHYGWNENYIWSAITGMAVGIVIAYSTEYFTSSAYPSTIRISSSSTVPGVILNGISSGMKSTFIPALAVLTGVLVSYTFSGLYGIALASVGMLSTLVVTLSSDVFGPIVDNAKGIATMAKLKTKRVMNLLDDVGNTTAAIGKGFAIGSAALTALALLVAYTRTVQIQDFALSVVHADVFAGLVLGASLPFVFTSLILNSVSSSASKLVSMINRKTTPEECVDTATKLAHKGMIYPALIAVATPLIFGSLFGPMALAGMLAGSIVTGFILAVFLANAGGAWDNAKKLIEFKNVRSKAYKATIIGDVIGDPFKDTAGPSLNILIKLMAIVSIISAPFITQIYLMLI